MGRSRATFFEIPKPSTTPTTLTTLLHVLVGLGHFLLEGMPTGGAVGHLLQGGIATDLRHQAIVGVAETGDAHAGACVGRDAPEIRGETFERKQLRI